MIKNIPIDKRIIFALDVESGDEAKKWIYLLSDTVKFFKIGLELFVNSGSSVVDEVLKRECEVMLDLKLYDIPKTVYRTVKQIVKRDISFLTVHGNMEILKAAVDAASFSNVGILGVTVLTSFDEKDLRQMGYPINPEELVLKRASLAKEAGCVGVVASGLEAKYLRENLGEEFILVTPGIRLMQGAFEDQKRVVTPAAAILNGADYLVIGRPIRDAKEPKSLVRAIQKEIGSILF